MPKISLSTVTRTSCWTHNALSIWNLGGRLKWVLAYMQLPWWQILTGDGRNTSNSSLVDWMVNCTLHVCSLPPYGTLMPCKTTYVWFKCLDGKRDDLFNRLWACCMYIDFILWAFLTAHNVSLFIYYLPSHLIDKFYSYTSDGKLEVVVPSFVHYLEVLEGSDGDKLPGSTTTNN